MIVFTSKGNTAEKVANHIKSRTELFSSDVLNLNTHAAPAQELSFSNLLLICPNYGDAELETGMEQFLVSSDWTIHKQKYFAVCELGLYRGYEDVSMGAGGIIKNYLEDAGLNFMGPMLSLDSIPLEDFDLINTWVELIDGHV